MTITYLDIIIQGGPLKIYTTLHYELLLTNYAAVREGLGGRLVLCALGVCFEGFGACLMICRFGLKKTI